MALFSVFVSTVYVTINTQNASNRDRVFQRTQARKVCVVHRLHFSNLTTWDMKIVPTKTQPAQTAHGQSNRSLSNVLKQAYHVAYLAVVATVYFKLHFFCA
jgi:hypothetical protein